MSEKIILGLAILVGSVFCVYCFFIIRSFYREVMPDYVFCHKCGVAVRRGAAKKVMQADSEYGYFYCQAHAPAYDRAVSCSFGSRYFREMGVNVNGKPIGYVEEAYMQKKVEDELIKKITSLSNIGGNNMQDPLFSITLGDEIWWSFGDSSIVYRSTIVDMNSDSNAVRIFGLRGIDSQYTGYYRQDKITIHNKITPQGGDSTVKGKDKEMPKMPKGKGKCK